MAPPGRAAQSSSQNLPKTSEVSFSISRTILPQNTKCSLEGVSKYMGIWISLWATQHIKSLMLCKKPVCSSGMQKHPQVQDPNVVLNNKLKCNSLHCETLDILKIYIRWPPLSAPRPFLQALSLRQQCPAGAACVGAEHAVALMYTATQLPKHSSMKKHVASEHINISASRQHQEQKPGGVEMGSTKLYSLVLPWAAIQEALDVSSRNHFFISILP